MDTYEKTIRVSLELRESTIDGIDFLKLLFPQLTQGDVVDLIFHGHGETFRQQLLQAANDIHQDKTQ